jgi:thiosulfate/3-mercaptopyruvate sulfurtransferase
MRAAIALAFGFALSLPAAHASDFSYADDAAPRLDAGAVVVDSRPLALCQKGSLKGARCIPAGDLLGPHRRLPNLFDIRWALGTAGLTGAETVLVVGDEPTARDFVAGILYLAGQREVAVLRAPLGRNSAHAVPGTGRGMTRERVYLAPARDELWRLRGDIVSRLNDTPAPALIDGRGESEFWGETARAARGGRLPGAESAPAATVRAALARGETISPRMGEPVVYAHDPYDGIAYFTLLRAGAGIAARVYPGGWSEWAADGNLPADAATYPARGAVTADAQSPAPASRTALLLASLALAAIFGAAGYYLGRRRARNA